MQNLNFTHKESLDTPNMVERQWLRSGYKINSRAYPRVAFIQYGGAYSITYSDARYRVVPVFKI